MPHHVAVKTPRIGGRWGRAASAGAAALALAVSLPAAAPSAAAAHATCNHSRHGHYVQTWYGPVYEVWYLWRHTAYLDRHRHEFRNARTGAISAVTCYANHG